MCSPHVKNTVYVSIGYLRTSKGESLARESSCFVEKDSGPTCFCGTVREALMNREDIGLRLEISLSFGAMLTEVFEADA